MWVAYGLLIGLLVAAALFDWQARRRGNGSWASLDYWRAASEERRELRLRGGRGGRRFGP